jgi:hypothetical protein
MRYIVLTLLIACGDNIAVAPDAGEICATEATAYNGAIVECAGGAGVCIAYGAEIRCQERCAEFGPACTDGRWRTTHTADGNVCYCEH